MVLEAGRSSCLTRPSCCIITWGRGEGWEGGDREEVTLKQHPRSSFSKEPMPVGTMSLLWWWPVSLLSAEPTWAKHPLKVSPPNTSFIQWKYTRKVNTQEHISTVKRTLPWEDTGVSRQDLKSGCCEYTQRLKGKTSIIYTQMITTWEVCNGKRNQIRL